MLVSQEFTPHFFADADSRVRPIPAHALVIHSEYLWTPVWNLVASFSVPTSEEIARIEGQAPWVYYYPKTMVLGADRPIVELTAPSSRKVALRLGGGIASPLSWRITSLAYPVVSLRARVAVGDAAGIHLGVGYVGNINQGLWMFPFGFGYRI
jgi:hypothetical protein